MFPPDLQELLARLAFQDAAAARLRLAELADDAAEWLALARTSTELGEALESSADPDAALKNLSRLVQARGSRLALYHLFQDDPASLERLIRVLAASQYLADVLVRNPEYFEIVREGELLAAARTREELTQELDRAVAAFPSPAARLDAVRRFRRREILRIGTADLCGILDLRQTTEQLSHLADAVVGACLNIVALSAEDTGLVVLALGKLGGGELNYSSDIDLVYLAEELRQVDAAADVARRLTGALGEATGEGFLYRVDLRLRPFGGAGALVVSAAMLEEYLARHADPAERQALLKARPIAGDMEAGAALLARLWPAVFSDAAMARGQVRQLKERIERQLRGRGEGHVKLTAGGIRDIEFLVQALQLEAGAAHPEIVTGNTLAALPELAAAGLLGAEEAQTLREAYVFLRLVEHRLQLMDNQQVHRLPQSPAELSHLARTLGFVGPQAADVLRAAYADRTRAVREIFERVLSASGGRQPPETSAAVTPVAASIQPGSAPPSVGSRPPLAEADLLAQIQHPADAAIRAQRESHQQWTVTVAMWDHLGVLSVLAGLLTAHGLDIVSGDVRSLRISKEFPAPRKRGPKHKRPPARTTRQALDTFVVHVPRWIEAPFWQALREELAELVGLVATGNAEAARERIIDRLSRSARFAQRWAAPLLPVEIEIDNEAAPDATRLAIRSPNTRGFLFEFTAALALLGVNIQRVEIRTLHHEVRDTFWVTDAQGRKIIDPDRLHELRVAAALIKQFTHLLPRSPDPAQALRQFSALARQMLSRPDWVADVQSLQSEDVLLALSELMGVSQFLWEDFLREQHENLFPVLRDIPALDAVKTKQQLREEQRGTASGVREHPDLLERKEVVAMYREADASVSLDSETARLNQFKDREMFRSDLRRITRRIDLDQFSRELTDLAEVVIERACELCHRRLTEQFGQPQVNGRPCGWCVCGLGKFGGGELGFASDIELIFVYAGEGSTSGPTQISNSRYFEEFVAEFLRTLRVRREGIFEIDLRLRPHGKAGTLASSLAGFAEYFSAGGPAEQFERLALVKLRPVVGDTDLDQRIKQLRDAFVYSPQPLDYANIRHLRQRQASELVPPRATSAKHSPGGLVDLEYFVQARQIEIGRSNSSVHVTGTRQAIDRLCQAGAVAVEQARQMTEAYQFLRELIEALRVVRGQAKDLTIPTAASREFAHLARRMDYESPAALAHDLERHMSVARSLWSDARIPQ